MKTKLSLLLPALLFSPLLLLGQKIPLTTLYSFDSVEPNNATNATGANPLGELVQASDGNFYGTTFGGGGTLQNGQYEGQGTVFRISPAGGVFTVLHKFTYADGSGPQGGLVIGKDGNFYGTTWDGGILPQESNGAGTVFKITPDGVLTTLHTFDRDDGWQSVAALTLGKDGNFYGTTSHGGDDDNGTIFKITPAGKLTTLHSFSALKNEHNADGAAIFAGLAQGSDGNFYGAAALGGANGNGTLFKVTPAGTFTTLHNFGASGSTAGENSDGIAPEGTLVLGRDGNFYGTASDGGSMGGGTIFKLTPAGVFTVLYTFFNSQLGSADGSHPSAGLVLGSDGNFYGATPSDTGGGGTIFRITPAGALTTLHNFSGDADGDEPRGGLAHGKDGNFYGTTYQGGSNDTGTIFILGTGTPEIISPPTAKGTIGATFTYQIKASGAPTHYGVEGLGNGMKVNPKTGLISGMPLGAGTHTLTLHATNSQGEGILTLMLTIDRKAPVITSPGNATATVGQPFSYQITAKNNPTRFGVLRLPTGLHVDAATGLISGTPTVAGPFHLILKAANGKGTGEQSLYLGIMAN